MRIRRALVEDATPIATVHVQSWRETYGGIVPQSEIESRTLSQRETLWQSVIVERPRDVYVAETLGRIVGFACIGRTREPLATDVELYSIYVLASEHGRGIGRALFHAVMQEAKGRGHRTMGLWVLADNRASGFYERLGGRAMATRVDDMGLPERAFAFDLGQPS